MSINDTFAFLSHVESEVLKQEHLAIAGLAASLFNFSTNAVALESDLALE